MRYHKNITSVIIRAIQSLLHTIRFCWYIQTNPKTTTVFTITTMPHNHKNPQHHRTQKKKKRVKFYKWTIECQKELGLKYIYAIAITYQGCNFLTVAYKWGVNWTWLLILEAFIIIWNKFAVFCRLRLILFFILVVNLDNTQRSVMFLSLIYFMYWKQFVGS